MLITLFPSSSTSVAIHPKPQSFFLPVSDFSSLLTLSHEPQLTVRSTSPAIESDMSNSQLPTSPPTNAGITAPSQEPTDPRPRQNHNTSPVVNPASDRGTAVISSTLDRNLHSGMHVSTALRGAITPPLPPSRCAPQNNSIPSAPLNPTTRIHLSFNPENFLISPIITPNPAIFQSVPRVTPNLRNRLFLPPERLPSNPLPIQTTDVGPNAGQQEETLTPTTPDCSALSTTSSNVVYRGCFCKVSECIKRLCPCFAESRLCKEGCHCENCLNTSRTPEAITGSRAAILALNPRAFDPREPNSAQKRRKVAHKKGCNCRKGCAKNYCSCRVRNVQCGRTCTCSGPTGCMNRECNEHTNTIASAGTRNSRADPSLPAPSGVATVADPTVGRGRTTVDSPPELKLTQQHNEDVLPPRNE